MLVCYLRLGINQEILLSQQEVRSQQRCRKYWTIVSIVGIDELRGYTLCIRGKVELIVRGQPIQCKCRRNLVLLCVGSVMLKQVYLTS